MQKMIRFFYFVVCTELTPLNCRIYRRNFFFQLLCLRKILHKLCVKAGQASQ